MFLTLFCKMFYWVKTPWWIRKFYSRQVWQMPAAGNTIYLSFDDGPHPVITNFVLDELKKYNAKATFFCLGKNVALYNDVYERILQEGHATGNHTHNHLNGWKTGNKAYVENIDTAAGFIKSNLFRPPYGKIKNSQRRILSAGPQNFKIIMWTVLSGDFDISISPELCADNIIKNTGAGSIVVLHDSEKAFERLKYALPAVLKYFSEKGYSFKSIAF